MAAPLRILGCRSREMGAERMISPPALLRPVSLCHALLAASLVSGLAISMVQVQAQTPASAPAPKSYPPAQVESGAALFRQDCSFCHGRDAGGGESGPDLTRSKLVAADVDGDKIGPVVRNGRPDKGMPPFDRSDQQIASLMAFIHTQQNNALAGGGRENGGRKGVDASDLQTGNAET